MPRPKNPFPSSQFNMYLRDDYRAILEGIASAETDKRQVAVNVADLMREAIIEKYKLNKSYGASECVTIL